MGDEDAEMRSLVRDSLTRADNDVVLNVQAMAKAFGPTKALRDCSLQLCAGEVHALMGENGSGKSTLVKILSGVHRPDSGTIEMGGEQIRRLSSPRDAAAAGIFTVFQEILVAPQQSVLANIWMGSDGIVRRRLSVAERQRRALDSLGRLIDVADLARPVERVSLNDRQAICIARALVRTPKILILDEATSALDVATRDNLFRVLKDLCAQGVGVFFISHRMDEVEEIADRVTVLRSGGTVRTFSRGEATPSELVALMSGSEATAKEPDASRAISERPHATKVVLRSTGVRLHAEGPPIDVEIRAGEIVGLAGLEGHGQDRFLRVLAGARPASGVIFSSVNGSEAELRSPSEALNRGVAYVPRDRRQESIFESRSILENFQLTTLAADRKRGLIRRASALERFEYFADVLGIRAGHRSNPITSLSGGNQQKVVIARWLAMKPSVLLLNDPTRGIDSGAKRDIYRVLSEAAAEGTAVVMLSTELAELTELMDRVLVFHDGQLYSDISSDQLDRTRLVANYFGREAS